MTCSSNLSGSPLRADLLPPYSARSADVDNVSIRSAAPSYTSAAPSYHSNPAGSGGQSSVPGRRSCSSDEVGSGTPAARSSSGHPEAGSSSVAEGSGSSGVTTTTATRGSNSTNHNNNNNNNRNSAAACRTAPAAAQATMLSAYSIPAWMGVRSSHQERHYQSVARRRAKAAAAAAASAASTAAGGNSGGLMSSPMSLPSSLSSRMMSLSLPALCAEDVLEEDPHVVGTEAAEQARRERLSRQRASDDAAALRQEGKSWDFMLKQMADWEARERSWTLFRRQAERPGFLRGKMQVLGTGRW